MQGPLSHTLLSRRCPDLNRVNRKQVIYQNMKGGVHNEGHLGKGENQGNLLPIDMKTG